MTQDFLDNYIRKAREARFIDSPQLSLGEIISKIEECGLLSSNGDDKLIYFDFGSAVPTTLDSWRGSYDELALGYRLVGYDNNTNENETPKAKDILKELKNAIDKQYTGWKGGNYIMSERTPVWVDNDGNANNTAIVDILDEGWRIIILTCYNKY